MGPWALVAAVAASACGAAAAVPEPAEAPCDALRVEASMYLPEGSAPLVGDPDVDLRALDAVYAQALEEAERAFADDVDATDRRAFFWRWVQRDHAPLRLDVDRFVLAAPLAEAGACLASATGRGDADRWRRRGGLHTIPAAE